MFNLVFIIVIFSMLVQRTSLRPRPRPAVQGPSQNQRVPPFKSRSRQRDFVEFEIASGSPLLGLDFPMEVLVVLVHRGGRDFIPRGNTQIELGDKLVCLLETRRIAEFEALIRPTGG